MSTKLLTLLGGGTKWLSPPTGYGWTPPVNVRIVGGVGVTNLDMDDYAITGSGVYYVAPDGDNANPGTLAQPLRGMQTALAKADADVIWVKPGIYHWPYMYLGSPARNISVRKYGAGTVILSTSADPTALSWATEAAPNASVWKATYATQPMQNVWDGSAPDANGDFVPLTLQESIAAVQANPGSYYIDGDDVYVQTTDSREPDSDIWVFLTQDQAKHNDPVNLYLEGISFYGGSSGFSSDEPAGSHYFAVKNCEFKYAFNNNGISMAGGALFIAENCVAACNRLDGFKFDNSGEYTPNAVLVNCVGRSARGTSASNGISSHANLTGHVMTVNCEFHNNAGPNHADIENCKTWCIAENCHDGDAENFYAGVNGSVTEFWCDSCVSSNPGTTGYSAMTGCSIYVRNSSGIDSTSGTVVAY